MNLAFQRPQAAPEFINTLPGDNRPHNQPDTEGNGGSNQQQDDNNVAFHKLILAPAYPPPLLTSKLKKRTPLLSQSMSGCANSARPQAKDLLGPTGLGQPRLMNA